MRRRVDIILAPSAALASTVDAHVTVEAEYGAVVAEGSVYTAAHHQPGMEDLPAPCNDTLIPVLGTPSNCASDFGTGDRAFNGTILVSHIDLDTIGGCLRALDFVMDDGDPCANLFRPEAQSFWNLAEFVDLNGPHKLAESGASDLDLDCLYAFWAWKRANVGRFSRDECTDVTNVIVEASGILSAILDVDVHLMQAGADMRAEEAALNAATLVEVHGDVLVRITSFAPEAGLGFCNHLYADPDGKAYKAVATFAKDTGSVTISVADTPEGVSCREISQRVWPQVTARWDDGDGFGIFESPEAAEAAHPGCDWAFTAGGHAGIAGSPRGYVQSLSDLLRAADALEAAIQ